MALALEPDMVRLALQPLKDELGKSHSVRRDATNGQIHPCLFMAVLIEGLWAMIQRCLRSGVEGRKCRFLLKEATDLVTESLAQIDQEAGSAPVDRSGIQKTDFSHQLRVSRERVQEIRDELSSMLNQLEGAPPTLIPTSSAGRKLKPDDYPDLDSVLASLRAGENL